MQIGPRLPTLGGSIGKAIGSVTEPVKKVASSPIGMTVLGTMLAGPLGGLVSKIPGVAAAGSAIGGAISNIPGASKVASVAKGALGALSNAGGSGGSGDGGLSTYEKLQLAMQGLGGVAGGVGQYMDSQAQQNIAGNNLAENRRQFDATNALAQKQFGESQRQFNIPQSMAASRSLANSPLRDQAAYMLGHRMMQTPSNFQGANIASMGQQGGIDPAVSAQHAAQYTPGAGGQGPNDELLRKLLASMSGSYANG